MISRKIHTREVVKCEILTCRIRKLFHKERLSLMFVEYKHSSQLNEIRSNIRSCRKNNIIQLLTKLIGQ